MTSPPSDGFSATAHASEVTLSPLSALASARLLASVRRVSRADRPVISWRFVVGVLLHFALPGYVVTVAVVVLLSRRPLLLAQSLRLVLTTSVWFVLLYSILIVALSMAARYADPLLRRRREALVMRDPIALAGDSAQRVTVAMASIEGIASGPDASALRIRTAAKVLRSATWQHEDRRFQALSGDLAMAASAFVTSFETADPERRSAIRLLAADALEHLARELRRLASEKHRLDYGDAQVAARYIELRYGGSDFTGDRLE